MLQPDWGGGSVFLDGKICSVGGVPVVNMSEEEFGRQCSTRAMELRLQVQRRERPDRYYPWPALPVFHAAYTM